MGVASSVRTYYTQAALGREVGIALGWESVQNQLLEPNVLYQSIESVGGGQRSSD